MISVSHRICFVLILLAAGCASGQKVPVSEAQLKAAAHNRNGVRAAAAGDAEGALAEFAAARRASASVEDLEGAAIALINSARIARFANRTTASRHFLEQAFPLVGKDSAVFPELAFEQAKLAMKRGDLDEAGTWAERAATADKGGALQGRLNLAGRIAALRGNYTEAESAATRARALTGDPEEGANTERILGDVYLATNRTALAREAYLAALRTDLQLGKSSKIATDLAALGRLCSTANQPDEAVVYHRRAARVHLARGDRRRAAEELQEAAHILQLIGKREEGLKVRHEAEACPADPALKGGE